MFILPLNRRTDSIREYGSGFFELWDDYTRNETDEDLVEAYAHNYFNWPKQDATAYLERVVQNYRTGEWISNYYGDVDTASDKIVGLRSSFMNSELTVAAIFRRDASHSV